MVLLLLQWSFPLISDEQWQLETVFHAYPNFWCRVVMEKNEREASLGAALSVSLKYDEKTSV